MCGGSVHIFVEQKEVVMEQQTVLCYVPSEEMVMMMYDLRHILDRVHMPWSEVLFTVSDDEQEVTCGGVVIPTEGLDLIQHHIHHYGCMLEFSECVFSEHACPAEMYVIVQGNVFNTVTQ